MPKIRIRIRNPDSTLDGPYILSWYGHVTYFDSKCGDYSHISAHVACFVPTHVYSKKILRRLLNIKKFLDLD